MRDHVENFSWGDLPMARRMQEHQVPCAEQIDYKLTLVQQELCEMILIVRKIL